MEKILRSCAHEIIMARDLLHQSEAQYQVPVRLLVLQGTGDAISTDYMGVIPHDPNYDPAVNPSTYVQIGLYFFTAMI